MCETVANRDYADSQTLCIAICKLLLKCGHFPKCDLQYAMSCLKVSILHIVQSIVIKHSLYSKLFTIPAVLGWDHWQLLYAFASYMQNSNMQNVYISGAFENM